MGSKGHLRNDPFSNQAPQYLINLGCPRAKVVERPIEPCEELAVRTIKLYVEKIEKLQKLCLAYTSRPFAQISEDSGD